MVTGGVNERGAIETSTEYYVHSIKKWKRGPYLPRLLDCKGWGLSAKLGKHSAIWGKLGTALQAYTLNPCTKFPPNPTSRKVNT